MPRGASGRSNSLRSPLRSTPPAGPPRCAATGCRPRGSPRGSPIADGRNGLNSIAVIAPSRATIRRSPIGESTTVNIVVISTAVVVITLCLRPCWVLGRARCRGSGSSSRRAPPTRAASARRNATAARRSLRPARSSIPSRVAALRTPDVGGQEHVGVTERPHRDVVGGPGPDAGQRQQARSDLLPVSAPVEAHVAVGRGPRRGRPERRPRERGIRQRRRGRAPATVAAEREQVGDRVRRRRGRAGRRARRPAGRRPCGPPRGSPAGRAPSAAPPRAVEVARDPQPGRR